MIKKIWIHLETDNDSSIFYDFTSRKEAIEFIESFEEDTDEATQDLGEDLAKEHEIEKE